VIFSDLYDPLAMPPYFRVAHDVEDLPPGVAASIASLGKRLSLVPNVSSFHYGLTQSNTYAFAWMIV
jgi:hypothetical protein